jgi:hypothetical protein
LRQQDPIWEDKGQGRCLRGGHYRRHWGGQLCRMRRRCSGQPAARRGGGRRGGGGAPGAGEDGVEEEDGAAAEEPRRPERPRHVGEEAARVPGADGGGPAVWRGRGCRRISGGRRRRIIPWGRGRGASRKAAVGEDDGGGGGGGHDDDDGGGSGTKKWLSARGGGSLLLYVDTPLVPGRVTNHDKRVVFCHGW